MTFSENIIYGVLSPYLYVYEYIYMYVYMCFNVILVGFLVFQATLYHWNVKDIPVLLDNIHHSWMEQTQKNKPVFYPGYDVTTT